FVSGTVADQPTEQLPHERFSEVISLRRFQFLPRLPRWRQSKGQLWPDPAESQNTSRARCRPIQPPALCSLRDRPDPFGASPEFAQASFRQLLLLPSAIYERALRL